MPVLVNLKSIDSAAAAPRKLNLAVCDVGGYKLVFGHGNQAALELSGIDPELLSLDRNLHV